MRFELTVALKYLLPKWRQLSVSIISLISVLVISLVVWLVVLFLSVTEGIERKWVEELVALNAPVRMAPTGTYYNSYYYQIDSVSTDSNYTTKTLAEKLASIKSDPYDPGFDRELSHNFPLPDRHADGRLKDPVKEGFNAIRSLSYKGVRPQEYEVSFGNLRLQTLRESNSAGETQQTFLTQVCYVASYDKENLRVNQMVMSLGTDDYNNLLKAIVRASILPDIESDGQLLLQQAPKNFNHSLKTFFSNLEVTELQTANSGFILPPSLFPKQGHLKGVALIRHGQIIQAVIPKNIQELPSLTERLASAGYQTVAADLLFDEGKMRLSSREPFPIAQGVQIVLDEKIPFRAQLLAASLETAPSLSSLRFQIEGSVQKIPICGQTFYDHLEIAGATLKQMHTALEPFWVYQCAEGGCRIPKQHMSAPLGDGLLIAKHFKKNGVCVGDRGYLAYYTPTGSSMQEQRIPVYVAGFYDPGMIPVGNKLIFVDPHVTAILRSNTAVADPMLGNGFNIWLDNLSDAQKFKEDLIRLLKEGGIEKYWEVQSYHDYEFTRPILEQLQSDKNLFTLIAVIILIVACSNIISMLILLVNDKKKEIGILQAMGASPRRIATIFGFCGFATGLISCIIGVTAAIFTLKNLQSLVALLSFFQGREAFQTAFYGSTLPNTLSYPVLSLVLVATLLISLLAGIIPAIKASKIRPTEILRSE
jgi:lipoprotein-releasing system permease protein